MRVTRRPITLPWALQESTIRLILSVAAFAGAGVGLIIPFLTLTARNRGVSLAAIGVMASSYLFAQMLLQLPMGMLSDRVGRAGPIALGLVIEAAATGAFIFADSAWSFILFRAIQGAGVAMVYPALRALIADVTPSNRLGQAFAGYGAAFNAGLLFGPLLGGILAAPIGVNALFLAAAAVEVAVAVASLALLRDKGVRHEREEVSQVPIRALIVRPLIGAFVLSFSNQFQMGLFSGIWSIYLADQGASDFLIGLSFTTYSVAYLIMAPLGGRQADSGKRWLRLLVSNLVLGCIMVSYGLLPSVLLILLMGLVEGAVTTVAQPSADAYLASVADPRVMGRVQGMYATIGMAGAAISAFLGSALYDIGRIVPFATAGGVAWLLTGIAVYYIRQTELRLEREGPSVQLASGTDLDLTTAPLAANPGDGAPS